MKPTNNRKQTVKHVCLLFYYGTIKETISVSLRLYNGIAKTQGRKTIVFLP